MLTNLNLFPSCHKRWIKANKWNFRIKSLRKKLKFMRNHWLKREEQFRLIWFWKRKIIWKSRLKLKDVKRTNKLLDWKMFSNLWTDKSMRFKIKSIISTNKLCCLKIAWVIQQNSKAMPWECWSLIKMNWGLVKKLCRNK